MHVQIAEHMYEVHAYLRMNLPNDHIVLTTPVLPMNIVVDSLPQKLVSSFMNGSNAITIPESEVRNIQRPYELLFCRSLAIHSANATYENVHQVTKSAVSTGVTRVIDSEQQHGQYFMSSPWHVAFEAMAVTALYGLPTVNLREMPKGLDLARIDMDTDVRLLQANIVGCVGINFGSGIMSKRIHVHRLRLQFSTSDLMFLIETQAKPESKNCSTTWCLTCPFPGMMMKPAVMKCCISKKCQTQLRSWVFKDPYKQENISSIAWDMRTFLTKVQSGLPRGNYANVFPFPPTTLVTHDDPSDECHQTLHALQNLYGSSIFFTCEPPLAVRQLVTCVRQAWLKLFHTTRLGHSRVQEAEFCGLQVYDISETVSSLTPTAWESRWHSYSSCATQYLQRFNNKQQGTLGIYGRGCAYII